MLGVTRRYNFRDRICFFRTKVILLKHVGREKHINMSIPRALKHRPLNLQAESFSGCQSSVSKPGIWVSNPGVQTVCPARVSTQGVQPGRPILVSKPFITFIFHTFFMYNNDYCLGSLAGIISGIIYLFNNRSHHFQACRARKAHQHEHCKKP